MTEKIIAATLLSAMTLFALPNSELELVLISKASQKNYAFSRCDSLFSN